MIEVTFTYNDEDKIIEFTAKGHAKTAEHGRDLVCASASILAYTLADNLLSLCECKNEAVAQLDSGDTKLVIPIDKQYERGKIVASAIEKGYCLLARNYPQAVTIKRIVHFTDRKDTP